MSNFNGETTAKEVASALADEIAGKTFLITGPSQNSLGAEVALSLAASKPKEIILVGRNKAKVQPVMDEIAAIDSKIKLVFVEGDLSDNESVKRAAAEISALHATIDSIICSAGIMAVPKFTTSKDGIESQFAANFVGHFLLVNLIISKLAKSSTVVTVTSVGYELGEVRFEDYNFENGKQYNPWHAYGQATTAKILFAFALSKKSGITGYSVHPGYVPGTALQSNNNVDMELMGEGFKVATERNGGVPPSPPPVRTSQQGAATIVQAAVDPKLKSSAPAYMLETRKEAPKDYATSEENQAKLWKLGNKLVGQDFPLN